MVLGSIVARIRGHIGRARVPSRATATVIVVGLVALGVGGALTARDDPTGAAVSSLPPTASSTTGTPNTRAPTTTGNPTSDTDAAASGATDAAVWDALAQCESGGDWTIDTHNGRYGGVQLDQGTWLNNGGGAYAPLPNRATRVQQIVVAERVRAAQGFSTWSSCAATLGLK